MTSYELQDLENTIIGFEQSLPKLPAPQALFAAQLLERAVKPLYTWLKKHVDHVQFFPYKIGAWSCIGFCTSGCLVRGTPLVNSILLKSQSAVLNLIQKSAKTQKSFTDLTFSDIKGSHLDIEVLHMCPRVPMRPSSPASGRPVIWTVKVSGAVAPWPFVMSVGRFCSSLNVARGRPADALSTVLSFEPVVEDIVQEKWTLTAETLRALDGAADPDPSSDSESVAGADLMAEASERPVSDAVVSGVVSLSDAAMHPDRPLVVASKLPSELPIPYTRGPHLFMPLISAFCNAVLPALYRDPVSVHSEAWKERLAGFGLSLRQFTQLRQDHLADKSAAPLTYPQPHSGIAFKVRSVRNAIEAALIRNAVEKKIDEALFPAVGDPLTILLYGDGAGRMINNQRLWMLACIPVVFTSIASLASVIPLAVNFGVLRDFQRTTMMGWLEEELREARSINYRGREIATQFVLISDLGDAWAAYTKETVASGRTVSFVTTATRGHNYLTATPCPCCAARMVDICCCARRESTRERIVWPMLRGTDLRMRYVNPRLHALINGLPKWLADTAIFLHRKGREVEARWVCTAFSQRGGFYPCAEIFDKEAPQDGEDPDRDNPGERESYGTKPRASVRGKDVKTFLHLADAPLGGRAAEDMDVDEINFDLPSDWRTTPVPPAGFHAGPAHIRVFLEGVDVQDVVNPALSMSLCAMWDDVLRYFRSFSPPKPSCLATSALRDATRDLGEKCFVWYKNMLAASHPWSCEQLDVDPPKWYDALTAAAKVDVCTALRTTHIDYPRTCIGVGVHAAFEHMTDIFDMLPYVIAEKVVEEAFDHFFSYLYHVVPAVANRSLLTKDNARMTWQVILEAHAAGIPVQTPAQEARVKNSAYF